MPTGKVPSARRKDIERLWDLPQAFFFLCLSGTSQTNEMGVVRALATPIPLVWDVPPDRNMCDKNMLQHSHPH